MSYSKEKWFRMNLPLSEEEHEAVDREAVAMGISRAVVVRMAIRMQYKIAIPVDARNSSVRFDRAMKKAGFRLCAPFGQ